MADQSKNKNLCPFWDKFGKRACRLVESGLFIPTREHILRFCENENFVKCYHYEGRSAVEDVLTGTREQRYSRNRRLFTRIPTVQNLSLSRYSVAKDTHEDLLDSGAKAVDLSLGGMRIETEAAISVNQIISFAFDENFVPAGYKGKAEVRWVRRDESHDKRPHAGLAFVDSETVQTVRDHLLGLGEKLLHISGS